MAKNNEDKDARKKKKVDSSVTQDELELLEKSLRAGFGLTKEPYGRDGI